MIYSIRRARPGDADDISRVIVATLRETNAKDYPEAVVLRLAQGFTPEAVLGLMEHRTMFVATLDARVVATASLEGREVPTVFVRPDCQGQGLGRCLMAQVEAAAIRNGIVSLTVPSSVTAEAFYARLGFQAVRESHYGDERTIVMERVLRPGSLYAPGS